MLMRELPEAPKSDKQMLLRMASDEWYSRFNIELLNCSDLVKAKSPVILVECEGKTYKIGVEDFISYLTRRLTGGELSK